MKKPVNRDSIHQYHRRFRFEFIRSYPEVEDIKIIVQVPIGLPKGVIWEDLREKSGFQRVIQEFMKGI